MPQLLGILPDSKQWCPSVLAWTIVYEIFAPISPLCCHSLTTSLISHFGGVKNSAFCYHADVLVWSLYMVTVYGHCTWSQYMVTVYGHYTWSLYMVTVHGHCIWSQYIVTVYGQCTWSLYLVTVYGHCAWSLYMISQEFGFLESC